MIINNKVIVIAVVICSLLSADVKAQESAHLVLMEELVDIYEELNSMFPNSDYVKLTQNEASYWVNRTMKPEYDFVGNLEKLQPTIKKLQALPCIGKKVVKEDSPAEGIIFACNPSFRDEKQENYVELIFNRNTIHFCYTSKRKHANYLYESNDWIAAEMNNLFDLFIARPNTTQFGIILDGPTYQYQLVTFTNSQRIKQHAEGIIFTIPDCSVEDWCQIADKMKSYAIKHNVQVAWNDVYRDYESVEILIDRESTIPIVFAAAFKDEELKLLRLEGTANHNIVLPRIWSEDSPVFNPKKNIDYIKQ